MDSSLPGFYYDQIKKRYFRVTLDSKDVAGTAAHQYSRSAVKKRDREEHARRLQAEAYRDQRNIITPVVRSKVVWDNSHVLHLARESGRCVKLSSGDIWAKAYSAHSLFKTYAGANCQPQDFRSPIVDIAHHAVTRQTFILSADQHIVICAEDNKGDINKSTRVSRMPLGIWEPPSCMTTTHGTKPLLVIGTEGGRFRVLRVDEVLNSSSLKDLYSMRANLGQETIECAAEPVPSSVRCKLAVAGSIPAILEIEQNLRQPVLGRSLESFSFTDSLCVTWQTPYTLSWGYRCGEVDVHDLRIPDKALRLQHSSPARKIRYVGSQGSHLIVAGLKSELAMYDLRWCPSPKGGESSPPYITYQGYSNQDRIIGGGFDVSSSLGLIASSRDEGGVALMDLWSGAAKQHQRSNTPAGLRVPAILFTEAVQSTSNSDEGVGRCFVAVGSDLESWIWGKEPA